MKNKLGMEIIRTTFTTLEDGEMVTLETMENEIVEEVDEHIDYNNVYLKILTLENCKKMSAIINRRYKCDYTFEEILNMNDELFLKKFEMFSFSHVVDNYYKSNSITESYSEDNPCEKVMEERYREDYMDWLYQHPYEMLLYSDSKDINFKISEEYAWDEGIYKIQLDKDIYIGQTNKFVRRYQQHKRGIKGDIQTNAHKLIANGATFEMIEIEKDEKQRLIKEAQYVNKYINDGYNVLNSTKVLFNGGKLKEEISVSFNKSDLDKITKLLSDNNIEFKPNKLKDKKETN